MIRVHTPIIRSIRCWVAAYGFQHRVFGRMDPARHHPHRTHDLPIGSQDHLTYLLTPWCRVLQKLTALQLVKKFPPFHGTRRFIIALTSVPHLSLSWASPIQSTYPHPTSWRSVLILSPHLRLLLPSGLLPSGFPTKTLYTPLLTHTCHMPSPSHSSWFYHPHNIGWGVQLI